MRVSVVSADLSRRCTIGPPLYTSIQITFDRHGHLFPGDEDEAAGRLDAYIAAAVTKPVTNDA
jgi:hypothetical protein